MPLVYNFPKSNNNIFLTTKRIGAILSCLFFVFVSNAQKYEWASTFDSDDYNLSLAIESDTNGNIVTTGFFGGTVDFDPGAGTSYLNSVSPSDVFVSKLDSLGQFVWARQFGGGISSEAGLDIVTDASGNIYFCGSFTDTVDFDPSSGIFNLFTTNLAENAFVCKLNPYGNLVWAKQFKASTGGRTAIALTIDDQQNCYVGGKFTSVTDFDPESGVFNLTSAGGTDIFITKLNPIGDLVWAKRIGGSQNDELRALDLDDSGHLYCTGNYSGTVDFNPGIGVYNLGSQLADIFILKLTNNGDFIWAKKMGGSQTEIGNCIKIDQSSNVYTIGQFKGAVDFDPGSGVMTLSAGSNFDAFVQKLDSSGNFLWVRQFGNSQDDYGRGLDLDSLNNVYITGEFMGTVDFELGSNIWEFSTSGNLNDRDIYICKLDSNGVLKWPKHIGGTGASEYGMAICLDNRENIYTTGTYMNTVDMNTGSGTELFISENFLEMFVHKLSPCEMTYSSISLTHCGNYTSPSRNYVWSNSGTYIDVITNSTGCDSVITINLTVIPLPTRTISVSTCHFYNSPSGNHTWSTSGTHYDTLPNPVGCDSMIIVQLSILQTTDTITINSCESFTSPSGIYTWTSNGFYVDTLTQINGCDSILVIDLSVNMPAYSNINVSVCNSFTSPSNLQIWDVSGFYFDTLSSINGCDSIISINLNILPKTYDTLEVSICNQYLSPSELYTWTTSGTYQDTLINHYGCDSIVTINLTINETTFSSQTFTTCDSLISPSGNYVWYNSGIYLDTISNANGCDSIITTYLTIPQISTEITVLNDSTLLSSEQVNATYQWLNCSDYSIIQNANTPVFIASENGVYAVAISQNNCVDTSECVTISELLIDSQKSVQLINVYPNPTTGILNITALEDSKIERWSLTDAKGIIIQIANDFDENVEIVLTASPGVYILKVVLQTGAEENISIIRI